MPIAAASLGQVHLARLDGERVVVKVQRPGLKELFDIDLKNLRVLAQWLQARASHPSRPACLPACPAGCCTIERRPPAGSRCSRRGPLVASRLSPFVPAPSRHAQPAWWFRVHLPG